MLSESKAQKLYNAFMNNQKTIVIVGGGAAGIMAALSVRKHHPQDKIIILDRTFALGRKILVCGAGRCNITNINLEHDPAKHYYGASPDFINSVFEQFAYADISNFFHELGINLYVEQKKRIGKLFPTTNRADTVTEILYDELEHQRVEVRTNCEVKQITKVNTIFNLLAYYEGKLLEIKADYVILAAGGKTYPALGADGSGYNLARSLGHNIIEPVPSALPLEAKNNLSQHLQGIRMELNVSAEINGEIKKSSTDEVMFTNYGLSGPAVLNVSREISIHLNRNKQIEAYVYLNAFPMLTVKQVNDLLTARWNKKPNQSVVKSLYGLFPNKVALAYVKESGISETASSKDISTEQKEKLIKILTNYKIKVQATRGWNEAEFTAGGVDTSEVMSTSLQSKLVSGLYFCGEILNVDGDVGGFNLSWAWSSGHVAGKLQ